MEVQLGCAWARAALPGGLGLQVPVRICAVAWVNVSTEQGEGSGWLCFVLVILLYCRHGTEVLSTVPKCKKAVDVPFGENMCVR